MDPLTSALLCVDSDTSVGLLPPGPPSHSGLSDGIWMKEGKKEEGRVGRKEIERKEGRKLVNIF